MLPQARSENDANYCSKLPRRMLKLCKAVISANGGLFDESRVWSPKLLLQTPIIVGNLVRFILQVIWVFMKNVKFSERDQTGDLNSTENTSALMVPSQWPGKVLFSSEIRLAKQDIVLATYTHQRRTNYLWYFFPSFVSFLYTFNERVHMTRYDETLVIYISLNTVSNLKWELFAPRY